MMVRNKVLLLTFCLAAAVPSAFAADAAPPPAQVELSSGWRLQDAAKVSADGASISRNGFDPTGWYSATVPGTVLTTLVNQHVYPEPLYGENDRPEIIPDSLARTSYWYRTTFRVPSSYAGRHVWLNFDGINYKARIWVNGVEVGQIQGAFLRGRFDVTAQARPGQSATLAVLISPEPHPGVPHEHTVRDGVGRNGGITGTDGATFLSTIGWDWLPAIRDRDSGIWQKVYLSATGAVSLKDPCVRTDLPLPRLDSADVEVSTTLSNNTAAAQHVVLNGSIGEVHFSTQVEIPANGEAHVSLNPSNTPALHLLKPRLWWPNGYGPQNLYTLHLAAQSAGTISDAADVNFGIRKISYTVPGSDNLTISVNGVPIFIRGGNWGLDEGLKRISLPRMEAQIRLHQLANLNLIRNWVGQSTSETLYGLCDKYGILVWDEFFQANPIDGPDPEDVDNYVANVRDKILRFRNHPSIALWCARNEGYPPRQIDTELATMLAELDPTRLYQSSSTNGRGVMSHGPYRWRTPREFYTIDAPFKTETGSLSVPTLESIQGMMPKKDWETINDDWAEHDFTRGNQGGDKFPGQIAARYGPIRNLADFVRKSQMADYEAFRAMYEGRNSVLFHPTTAIITWMSQPAQPSFVWQIYHYDLEPNASFFGVQHANEAIHVQLNEATGEPQIINNRQDAVSGTLHTTLYNLDGRVVQRQDTPVKADGLRATTLTAISPPADVSSVYFVELSLDASDGKRLSRNVYWRASGSNPDDLTGLNSLEPVRLEVHATVAEDHGERRITVSLHNPTFVPAVMTHVQLHRASGERVLPAYYSDNYITVMPQSTETFTVEAAARDFHNERALLEVDGWNVSAEPVEGAAVEIRANTNADPAYTPYTGLSLQTTGLR